MSEIQKERGLKEEAILHFFLQLRCPSVTEGMIELSKNLTNLRTTIKMI